MRDFLTWYLAKLTHSRWVNKERRTVPGVFGAWMREGAKFPGKGGGFFWGDGGATRTFNNKKSSKSV